MQLGSLGLPIALMMVIGLGVLMATRRQKSAGNTKGSSKSERPKKKTALTEREQAMYWRLREVLSERTHVVMAQVSFSALLTSRQQAARNTFNRKTADFVVFSKAFEVVAVIELDDASHRGREKEDGARESLLTDAGYRVIRFKNIPDRGELITTLFPMPTPMPLPAGVIADGDRARSPAL